MNQPAYTIMSDCEFDIDGEDVFCVERSVQEETKFLWKTVREEQERTVIGFYDKKTGELREWYLDCPVSKHNQFVKRFRSKLGLLTQEQGISKDLFEAALKK